jgi:hypothetical protein
MRTLQRRRDRHRPNLVTISVAIAAEETLPFAVGEETAIEDLGWSRIIAVRRVDSPEPGLARGERVLAIDVQTLETSGDVPDIP